MYVHLNLDVNLNQLVPFFSLLPSYMFSEASTALSSSVFSTQYIFVDSPSARVSLINVLAEISVCPLRQRGQFGPALSAA